MSARRTPLRAGLSGEAGSQRWTERNATDRSRTRVIYACAAVVAVIAVAVAVP